MIDPLTTAVHRLTRVTRTKVIQDGDGSEGSNVAIVVHMPLLLQLSEAVTSAIGSGGGGGTATGSVLNDGAYDLAVFKVRAAIGDWLRIEGVRPTRDLVVDLEAWGSAFNRTDKEPAFYIRTMEGWAALIENLLDPPSRLELTEPCPVCNQDEYTDAEGRTLKFPVVIEFRRDRPGEARGTCRACDKLWIGVLGLRELRWMTDDNGQKEVG